MSKKPTVRDILAGLQTQNQEICTNVDWLKKDREEQMERQKEDEQELRTHEQDAGAHGLGMMRWVIGAVIGAGALVATVIGMWPK